MFDDYESHLVPKEACVTIASSDWSYIKGYIIWFFRVSHSYMVHAALGDLSRPTHHEILEEEQVQLDHTDDVLPRYRRIMKIVRESIHKGIFHDESGVRQVLDAIMAEAHRALLYRRHRRRTGRIDAR